MLLLLMLLLFLSWMEGDGDGDGEESTPNQSVKATQVRADVLSIVLTLFLQ